MNAYELATTLDCSSSDMEYGYAVTDWKLLSDAANMLRHQADQLKASELHEKRGWLYAEELEQERKRQADRIAELEKEIQNLHMDEMVRIGQEIDAEPVAWINEDNFLLGDVLNSAMYRTKPTEEFTIPLYTTPQTKPLHEDIIYGLCYKYGIEKGDVLEFARAIEERHGIK